MSTFAPCSLSSSAVARPIPRALPVTIATFSSRTPMPVKSPWLASYAAIAMAAFRRRGLYGFAPAVGEVDGSERATRS